MILQSHIPWYPIYTIICCLNLLESPLVKPPSLLLRSQAMDLFIFRRLVARPPLITWSQTSPTVPKGKEIPVDIINRQKVKWGKTSSIINHHPKAKTWIYGPGFVSPTSLSKGGRSSSAGRGTFHGALGWAQLHRIKTQGCDGVGLARSGGNQHISYISQ